MKGTLEENITYGVKDYTFEDMVKATKDAHAYEFIMDKAKFPKGFDTEIEKKDAPKSKRK